MWRGKREIVKAVYGNRVHDCGRIENELAFISRLYYNNCGAVVLQGVANLPFYYIRREVVSMMFTFEDMIYLGMFIIALLTYLDKRR